MARILFCGAKMNSSRYPKLTMYMEEAIEEVARRDVQTKQHCSMLSMMVTCPR